MNKLNFLFITLFCIISSFFCGYYFWWDIYLKELQNIKKSLQVTLHLHGNTLDIEKSHTDIRVIIDGKELPSTGKIELKRE
jgi:hypothetical protein